MGPADLYQHPSATVPAARHSSTAAHKQGFLGLGSLLGLLVAAVVVGGGALHTFHLVVVPVHEAGMSMPVAVTAAGAPMLVVGWSVLTAIAGAVAVVPALVSSASTWFLLLPCPA